MQTPTAAAGTVEVEAPDPGPATVSAPPRDLFEPPPRSRALPLARRLQHRGPAAAAAHVAGAAYLAFTASMLMLGVCVTQFVVGGALGGWDLDVNRWLVDRRTVALDDWSRYGSFVADTVTVVLLASLLVTLFAFRRHVRAVALIAVGLGLEVTVFLSITFFVDRERPDVARLDVVPPTSSFPSGHTAAAIVLYATIALLVTMYVRHRAVVVIAWVAAVLLPVMVSWSRLYRGMHHPTDIAAGVLLGVACVCAAVLTVRTAVAVEEASTS